MSIRLKLTAIIIFTAFAALIVEGILSYYIQMEQTREMMINNMEILAGTIGNASVAAITFDRPDEAHQSLAALSSDKRIRFAAVFTPDQKLFASYMLQEGRVPISEYGDYSRLSPLGLEVMQRIVYNRELIGYIWLDSDLTEFQKVRQGTLKGLVSVGAGALFMAMVLSLVLQRIVTVPLLKLNEVTLKVAEGEFGTRVDLNSSDELGQLGGSFNKMSQDLEIKTNHLLSSKKYTESIIDSMNDVLFVFNAEGRITQVNQFGVELLNYSRAEFLQMKYSDIIDKEQQNNFDNVMISRILAGHVLADQETQFVTNDGVKIDVAVNAHRLQVGNDAIVLVARDIREAKQTQRQLIHTSKMASLGELVAGIAHELNNALNFVIATLPQLSRDIDKIFEMESFDSSEDANRVFQKINRKLTRCREGAKRSAKIIKSLRTFSHAEQTEMGWHDLHECISLTVDLLPHEHRKGIAIHKEFAELPEVWCCKDELNQVFMNMLVNAAQAIEATGDITINTYSDDHFVYVKFSDTGKGIQPDEVSRIFNPFFTTKEVGVGTGLGLSISNSIVEKHNGHIEVDSEVGVGTRFTICLPKGNV